MWMNDTSDDEEDDVASETFNLANGTPKWLKCLIEENKYMES